MSDITSYLSGNGDYNYKRWEFVSQGASDVSGTNGTSGANGMSGTGGASNVSMASGHYEWVNIGQVQNLTIEEIVNTFTHGNLTKGEMDKWLASHQYSIKNLVIESEGDMITYKFTYGTRDYTVSCSKEAAESQLDNITSITYTLSLLKQCYNLTYNQINKYFLLVSSGLGSGEKYALNPQYGFKNAQELVKYLEEHPEDDVNKGFWDSEIENTDGVDTLGETDGTNAANGTQEVSFNQKMLGIGFSKKTIDNCFDVLFERINSMPDYFNPETKTYHMDEYTAKSIKNALINEFFDTRSDGTYKPKNENAFWEFIKITMMSEVMSEDVYRNSPEHYNLYLGEGIIALRGTANPSTIYYKELDNINLKDNFTAIISRDTYASDGNTYNYKSSEYYYTYSESFDLTDIAKILLAVNNNGRLPCVEEDLINQFVQQAVNGKTEIDVNDFFNNLSSIVNTCDIANIKNQTISNYINQNYSNLIGNVLNNDLLEMINANISNILEKEEISQTSDFERIISLCVDTAVEIAQVAQQKGVDPVEYVSARLVDFVDMRIVDPSLAFDEMNDNLASDILINSTLNSIEDIFSDLGEEISVTNPEELMFLGMTARHCFNEEPEKRIAYMEIHTALMLMSENITNQQFHDLIKNDLFALYPGTMEMDEVSAKKLKEQISKLSTEEIIDLIKQTFELPAESEQEYENAYNAFIAEFAETVNKNSGNEYVVNSPDSIKGVKDIYKEIICIEFNADNIIDYKLFNNRAEVICEASGVFQYVLETIETVTSSQLSAEEALYRIAAVYNNFDETGIREFIKDIIGSDFSIENNKIITKDSYSALGKVRIWCRENYIRVTSSYLSIEEDDDSDQTGMNKVRKAPSSDDEYYLEDLQSDYSLIENTLVHLGRSGQKNADFYLHFTDGMWQAAKDMAMSTDYNTQSGSGFVGIAALVIDSFTCTAAGITRMLSSTTRMIFDDSYHTDEYLSDMGQGFIETCLVPVIGKVGKAVLKIPFIKSAIKELSNYTVSTVQNALSSRMGMAMIGTEKGTGSQLIQIVKHENPNLKIKSLIKTETETNMPGGELYISLAAEDKAPINKLIYNLLNNPDDDYLKMICKLMEPAMNAAKTFEQKLDTMLKYLYEFLGDHPSVYEWKNLFYNFENQLAYGDHTNAGEMLYKFGKWFVCCDRSAAVKIVADYFKIPCELVRGIYYNGKNWTIAPELVETFSQRLGRKINAGNLADWVEIGANHAWNFFPDGKGGGYIVDMMHQSTKITASSPEVAKYFTDDGKRKYSVYLQRAIMALLMFNLIPDIANAQETTPTGQQTGSGKTQEDDKNKKTEEGDKTEKTETDKTKSDETTPENTQTGKPSDGYGTPATGEGTTTPGGGSVVTPPTTPVTPPDSPDNEGTTTNPNSVSPPSGGGGGTGFSWESDLNDWLNGNKGQNNGEDIKPSTWDETDVNWNHTQMSPEEYAATLSPYMTEETQTINESGLITVPSKYIKGTSTNTGGDNYSANVGWSLTEDGYRYLEQQLNMKKEEIENLLSKIIGDSDNVTVEGEFKKSPLTTDGVAYEAKYNVTKRTKWPVGTVKIINGEPFVFNGTKWEYQELVP